MTILHHDEPVDDIYLIKSGCVKVYSKSYHLLTEYNEGSFFGEYQILLDLNSGC